MAAYIVNRTGATHQVDDSPREDREGRPLPSYLDELLASGKGFRMATPEETTAWWSDQGLKEPKPSAKSTES